MRSDSGRDSVCLIRFWDFMPSIMADGFTNVQLYLRAKSSASFKGDTSSIAEATKSGSHQSGARFVTDAIMVGGGVPLYAEGALVGAVGVSGAPSAGADEKCAQKGADLLEDKLLF